MTDRITPYDEGGRIADRIDEIVMTGVDVHLEMMGPDGFYLSLTKDGKDTTFRGVVKRHKLIIRKAWEWE